MFDYPRRRYHRGLFDLRRSANLDEQTHLIVMLGNIRSMLKSNCKLENK
jgi:hypothetical protein